MASDRAPYSPDLTTTDIHVIPEMEMQLKGHRFNIVVEIQGESQKILDSLTLNDFPVGF